MGGYLHCCCKHATAKANPSLPPTHPPPSVSVANTCGCFDFRAYMKELLKWCIYKYPHLVFQRRRHPTAVGWLIISWNTVLVAWLLSSCVANYIAWPLPAWCITLLLRLAPLWPPPPRPPSSLFVSLKSSPQTRRRVRPFLVHLISAAHEIWQLVKRKWQSPNLHNLPPQFIKKSM